MIQKNFEIDGMRYVVDKFGAVHQDPPEITQTYDKAYVAKRYDSIPEAVRRMSFLRAGFIIGAVGPIHSLLDVGYGNGDFLSIWRLWASWSVDLWGLDISGYPLPKGSRQADMGQLEAWPWDLVTFFDSLEHMADLGFLRRMKARHVAMTIPWCRIENGIDWFRFWKHRRPGEHLHHFSPISLVRMMEDAGYKFMTYCSLEDAIRRPQNSHENTFTAVFRKC